MITLALSVDHIAAGSWLGDIMLHLLWWAEHSPVPLQRRALPSLCHCIEAVKVFLCGLRVAVYNGCCLPSSSCLLRVIRADVFKLTYTQTHTLDFWHLLIAATPFTHTHSVNFNTASHPPQHPHPPCGYAPHSDLGSPFERTVLLPASASSLLLRDKVTMC